MDTAVNELLIWAEGALATSIDDAQEIARTRYSLVLRLDTPRGVHYLKQTPPELYREAGVIDRLNAIGCIAKVPVVAARSDDLHCFLMPAAGAQTLRTLFDGTLDPALFETALATYVAIQKATQSHSQYFLDLGACDWRGEGFVQAYKDMLRDDVRLAPWALTPDERACATASIPLFERLADDVAALGLPATLNHSDFHDNAMLRGDGDAITIIDWGEVAIGCPLFPLAAVPVYMRHRYPYLQDEQNYQALRNFILKAWNVKDDGLFELLGPVQYVLTFYELIKITDGVQSPKWREHCKNGLFGFLDRLDARYA